jgi:hypothetical protein
MGLLDYLFDPNTYGDSPGGLLSRLQPGMMGHCLRLRDSPRRASPRLPLPTDLTRFLPRRSLPPSRIASMPAECRCSGDGNSDEHWRLSDAAPRQ